MSTPWRMRWSWVPLVVVLVGAAACSGDDQTSRRPAPASAETTAHSAAGPPPPHGSDGARAARDALEASVDASVAAADHADDLMGRRLFHFHFLTEGGEVVTASPWTGCLGAVCWDGVAGLGGPIPSVGSPEALYFAFERIDWRFRLLFQPAEGQCGGRVFTDRATPVSDHVFRIDAPGRTGRWKVEVAGRGTTGGDAVTTVNWDVPAPGAGEARCPARR